MTPEAKIAVLETEVKHLRTDLEEVKAVALGNQQMLRWAMGAAAVLGALMPIILPRLAEALGLK